jgi:predicted phage-related endonuclease
MNSHTKSYMDRRSFIGGSDARIIMGNDEAALSQLWREKRGEAQPEDLSGNLIVQLGSATEELNLVRTQFGPACERHTISRQTLDHSLHGRHARRGGGKCRRHF